MNRDLKELRGSLDSNDPFMSEGHQILKTRRHKKVIPDWAKNDKKIQIFLLRSFPKLRTDKNQSIRAGRWARVIQLYFRMGHTHGQIADELGVTYNTIKMIIRAVKLSAAGRRADGRGILGANPKGRPRKHDTT